MFGEWVVNAFDGLTPDLDDLYRSASTYHLSDWRLLQQGLVTGSGAVTVAIPVAHLVGMAGDVVFLMNRMSVCSYGIGAILGARAERGSILEREDFAVVLARWSGDDGVSNASIAKAAGGAAGYVGGKVTTKLLAKLAAENAGILIGKKLGAKTGAKIAGKFAAKLGTKAVGGFIPFVGPAIGGGVNLWFITSIAREAEDWYRFKLSHGEDE
jgi:hypothetical protein